MHISTPSRFHPRFFIGTMAAAVLLWGLPAWAGGQNEKPEQPEQRVHSSACALAESMAGSLRKGPPLDEELAEETCKALQPTMDAGDAAAFQRCCMKRFTED